MSYVLSPDPEFLDQLEKLEEGSAAAADAALLIAQRKWMYPPLNSWSGNPHDITGMNSAFARANLNDVYIQAISDPSGEGRTGEIMALKLQVDYIATIERAFRTRHCSSVRAKLHAAARRQGQRNSSGLFSGNVTDWIERLIFAAHDDA